MDSDNQHYATTETATGPFRVYFGNELVLEAATAVLLREHYQGREFAPVVYFDPANLDGLEVTDSDKTTFCPIKGTASYLGFRGAEDVIWRYQAPLDGVAAIRGHLAFDLGSGFRVEGPGLG